MAQDIRELLKNSQLSKEQMPQGHQLRFADKLEQALPQPAKKRINWLQIAASLVILLGLSFGAYKYFTPTSIEPESTVVETSGEESSGKSLGDISPELTKVEDYYLATINVELSKIKPTPETRELFDGYLARLNELNNEYERLTKELTSSGPSEFMINALIDNLKLRLNLLYKMRSHLQELQSPEEAETFKNQTT